MNKTLNKDDTQENYAAFVAVDWADQRHVWSLQAAGQTKKETGTLEQKPEVIGPWVAKLRERFGGRPVALALDKSGLRSRRSTPHLRLCRSAAIASPHSRHARRQCPDAPTARKKD